MLDFRGVNCVTVACQYRNKAREVPSDCIRAVTSLRALKVSEGKTYTRPECDTQHTEKQELLAT